MSQAKVTPLHEKGDPLDLNNYRLILPLAAGNTFFNQLSQYINDFNILSPFRSGFHTNFSTTIALVKCTNDVFSSLDKGQYTGAIFIGLTKAFDFVRFFYHLLDKLYAIGVSLQALSWFNSFLHKHQCVSFHHKIYCNI